MKVKIISSISLPIIILFIIGYFDTMEFLKIIPTLLSLLVFFFFLEAYVKKKKLILTYTQKFYKKELSVEKKMFLASSDGYWTGIILVHTLIQIALVFYAKNEFWALYSSVGWYIYLLLALSLQILYERLFIISKVKS